MPITPLHFGLMAPIRHVTRRRVSLVSFTLVNLWIDLEAILAWAQGLPLPSHMESSHTYVGAMISAVIVAMLGVRSMPWALGAFLGALSHVFLDSLVHAHMQPFWPYEGNPMYMGWMAPVSLILMPLTVWLIAQIVSDTKAWLTGRWAVIEAHRRSPSD